MEILYGDTDSVFIKKPTKEQIQMLIKYTEEKYAIDLEVDKEYRYLVLSDRKKNYFGIKTNGKMDIKGLTGKKSVDGKTKILIKKGNKSVLTDVETTYDMYQKNKNIQVLTITDDLKSKWVNISDATKHMVNDVYELESNDGRKIKLSGDHSVFIIDSYGKLKFKETKDLKLSDVLVGLKNIETTNMIKILDIKKYLNDITKDYNNDYLVSNKNNSTTGFPIQKTINIDSKLCYILGIYTAEGSCSGRTATFTQDNIINKDVCEEIEKSWVFDTELKCYGGDKGSKLVYQMPYLISQLFSRLCGANSINKHIPEFLFDVSEDNKCSYLNGLFSGDRFIDNKSIQITSKSKILMEEISYILSTINISSLIKTMKHKKYGNFYTLRIKGVKSRQLFQEKIGFTQKRKKKIKFSSKPIHKELLPVSTNGLIDIKNQILKRKKISKFRNINFHDDRYYNLSLLENYNTIINKMYLHANIMEKTSLNKIYTMINSNDVTFDKIKNIKKIKGSQIMYDFSVPKYERFVAGNLPTLLHNSHTPPFLKQLFNKILDELTPIEKVEQFTLAKYKIKTMIKETIDSFDEIPMAELAFNVQINQEPSEYDNKPQSLLAAEQLMDKPEMGMYVQYVKTWTTPKVKPVMLVRRSEVDKSKYIESIEKTLEQITDPMDIDFDVILGKGRGAKLDEWFN
jgi:intein/homing endonuclease